MATKTVKVKKTVKTNPPASNPGIGVDPGRPSPRRQSVEHESCGAHSCNAAFERGEDSRDLDDGDGQ